MEITCVQSLAIAGLISNLVGVLVLFRYGMPYRVETKGEGALLLEGTDEEAIAIEKVYRRLGYVGLCLVIIGTGLQSAAVVLAH
ncbi:MAG: hypothetical protein V4499_02120 [Pseudomonadota bacterium]